MPELRIDLHLHSDRSDGRYAPDDVLARAARNGLDAIALSDHDLEPALPIGVAHVGGRDVRVIAAAEVSGQHEGREFHLLVYFPGDMPEDWRAFLRGRARERAERYDAAIARLGLPLPPADAVARAGHRALTRHHLARALQAGGFVSGSDAAFRLLSGPRNVPLITLPFVDAIRRATAFGAYTSWAHPSLVDAQRHLAAFVAAGLHGLEADRPGLDRPTRNGLRRLAKRHQLGVTGGSDWHGWWQGDLGDYAFVGEHARAFLARLDA